MRNVIKHWFRAFGVELRHYPLFRRAIHILVVSGEKPYFVQVGANNGIDFDDFFDVVTTYDLPGIVVEPVPYYFEVLEQAYKQHRTVIPVNVALHPSADEATLYRVDPSKLSFDWQHGIGSFSRDHLIQHGVTTDMILAEKVSCMSFDELLGSYLPQGRTLDILVTDTEGFDAEILAMVDLDRWRPKAIKYESAHLQPEPSEKLRQHLVQAGYVIEIGKQDTVAVRRDLASRWNYLKRSLLPAKKA